MRDCRDMGTRIIVAGGRSFQDYDLLKESLDKIVPQYENVEIVSGHANGAAILGEQYAQEHGLPCSVFPAEWKKYGRRAGFIRNSQMLEYAAKEKPLVVAFWNGNSTGTKDTLYKAEQMGITRYVFGYNEKDILNEKRPVKIWLDDIRPAPEGYYHCHSVNEAKAAIRRCELNGVRSYIAEINCDHDLGDFAKDGGDGICLIDWLREREAYYYEIVIHTMNPVGRKNMQKALDRYKEEEWKDFEKIADAANDEAYFTACALQIAASYFQEQLYSDEGADALEWLKNRGLTDESIKRFNLGYSGKTKDGLHRYLTEAGFGEEEDITKTILSYYRKMTAHNYFLNRIMFPIIEWGEVDSFCGRALDNDGPVFLYAPENIHFNKFSKKYTIYGLYLAKESGKTELILCEGYLDVILLHQEGFVNAVSTPWSSLTKEQAAVLKQYADSVILSYDSDEAGKRGASRAAGLLKEAGLTVKKLDVSPYRDPYELLRKEGKKGYVRRLEETETL